MLFESDGVFKRESSQLETVSPKVSVKDLKVFLRFFKLVLVEFDVTCESFNPRLFDVFSYVDGAAVLRGLLFRCLPQTDPRLDISAQAP